MMKLLSIFFFAALLAAQPVAIPPAEQAELAALLPVPASFGFKPKEAPRFAASDRAEAYQEYGLVAAVHQEYQSTGLEVAVDLYDMGEPLRAFGIYAAERSSGDRFVEIGGEGYTRDGLLTFIQGRYYVKVAASGRNGPVAPMLDTVAKYISRKIWTGTALPKEIAWFPSRGLVPHSQKYLVRSPMGRDFLAPAATALYRFNGRETTLLISMAANPEDAAARLALLKQSVTDSGGATAVAEMPSAWRGASQAEGEMILLAQGRYAVVVVHPPSPAQAFLKEIVSSIKE